MSLVSVGRKLAMFVMSATGNSVASPGNITDDNKREQRDRESVVMFWGSLFLFVIEFSGGYG